jgi:hypothetical protein
LTIVVTVSAARAREAEAAVRSAFEDHGGGPWTVMLAPSESRGRSWWSVKVVSPREVFVMSVLPEELGPRLRARLAGLRSLEGGP